MGASEAENFCAVACTSGNSAPIKPTAADKLWAEVHTRRVNRSGATKFADAVKRASDRAAQRAKFLMQGEFNVPKEMEKADLRARYRRARAMGPTYVAALTMELAYANALAKMNEFITALRSEHTIVSAVAPSADDTAGDHLHDENVIHIFFTTMLAELCVLCLLRGGADVPVISITTVINGIITTSACCSFAMAQKQLFRFGNKKRWRSPYKPTLVWRTIRFSWRAFH